MFLRYSFLMVKFFTKENTHMYYFMCIMFHIPDVLASASPFITKRPSLPELTVCWVNPYREWIKFISIIMDKSYKANI